MCVYVQVAALPRPLLTAGRSRFNVFSQAVTTTPETEAEAEAETSIAESSVDKLETTEDVLPTTKSKKLTKRVKHIMEVSGRTKIFPILSCLPYNVSDSIGKAMLSGFK